MKRPQTVRALEAFKHAVDTLTGIGIRDANEETRVIFRDGLELDTLVLYRDNPVLSIEQIQKLNEILERRKKREPLQYILGFVWFYGLKVLVGSGALVPRPETEILVREALNRAHKGKKTQINVLDLCTGSGAIALALAKELPLATVTGVDISEEALAWAEKNRELNRAENVRLLKGDLFSPVEQMRFSLITANPPYIKDRLIEKLEPEVSCWEPRVALSGGEEGLSFTRDIIAGASARMEPGGHLLIELAGGTDTALVSELAVQNGLQVEDIIKDLAGWERVFIARKPRSG
ncbi:MAG: peptide chain release factor N(5)-glutamine methyltransferase [Nitrospiraceae bacterium]|nr:peptide chain release factor N(5)-glutamine methyltransferase [Nitrospiraceae bacterium]